MRPPGTALQLERRRRQAIRLLKTGTTLSAIARAVGASVRSVFRWAEAYRTQGLLGLRPRPTPGRPPSLSVAQKKRPAALLLKGPLARGDRTDLWTLKRVAQLIHQQFEVRSHPCHGWKLLTQLGWSCQKPERRALQRDEAAIARWRRSRWSHKKKTLDDVGSTRLS